MLFVRYESFRQFIRLYPVITLILAVQLVVFVAVLIAGGGINNNSLLRFGAMFAVPGFVPEYWRYVTAIFLHGGFDHLLFNSFALFVFGPPIERVLGKFIFPCFYILSGIVGNIMSYQLHNGIYVGVGASGAIYGIFGALLFLGLYRRDIVDQQSIQTVVIVLVVGVIYSVLMPRIDIFAHIGGFIGGFILFSILSQWIPRFAGRGSG